LLRARTASGLPVVMKDFIVEPSQIVRGVAAGADAILLLASLLDAVKLRDFLALLEAYGCDGLVEVHDEEELARAVEAGAKLIGVNNRNLRDFHVDLGTSERLGALMPAGTIRVAESGIKTVADVTRLRAAGFHAFLVGESLLRQSDRAAAVRALVQS
jgi:indole-3-glycerol phosphate synthase